MPGGPKLRMQEVTIPLQVALIEPEIPPNTGSVARTCVATGSKLHLVQPLGFDISAQAVRRAGLDYWPLLDLQVHDDRESFFSEPPGRLHFFASSAKHSYLEADFQAGDALVFGKESVGLDQELYANAEHVWAIPTRGVRSLNLSNSVAIVLYEALRKMGSLNSPQLGDE